MCNMIRATIRHSHYKNIKSTIHKREEDGGHRWDQFCEPERNERKASQAEARKDGDNSWVGLV